MKLTIAVLALTVALALPARADDLLQVYHDAQQNDPALASARAIWQATQERLPQARAGLLPNVNAAAGANINRYDQHISVGEGPNVGRNFAVGSLSVSASQPIFRVGNVVTYDQAQEQVAQADYQLATAQQDLMLRVTVTYLTVHGSRSASLETAIEC